MSFLFFLLSVSEILLSLWKMNVETFVESTLKFTVPELVVKRDKETLVMIQKILKKNTVIELLLNNLPRIFFKIFRRSPDVSPLLSGFLSHIQEAVFNFLRDITEHKVSISHLLNISGVSLMWKIICELGTNYERVSDSVRPCHVLIIFSGDKGAQWGDEDDR